MKINSWHPDTGFENSSAFGLCLSKPITHMKIAMEKHFPFYQVRNATHLPEGADINLLSSLATALNFK